MECLAAFVVLLVLPLAVAGVLVGWRALRVAKRVEREARAELERLRERLGALEAGGGEVARAAPVAPRAAVSTSAPSAPPAPPPATYAPAGTADLSRTAALSLSTAPSGAPVEASLPPPPPPRDADRPAAWPAAAAVSSPMPAAPAAPRVSLEERLGARLPVWIGAAALVLAVGFLVKYSFDRGWIGPTVRVLLGAGFGLALLGAGELLRRSAERVAQGLAAAGVAVLFVVQWAALELYELVSPGAGFVLLAATTALAVALSLRHGAIVALLGLVGGFLTPALVATPDPDPRPLFAWLLLLQVGLLAVSRRRSWSWLAALNLVAALAWTVAWLAGERTAGDAAWIGAFLVATLAVFLLATQGAPGSAGSGTWSGRAGVWLRGAAAAGTLLVCGLLASTSSFSLLSWGYLLLLAAGCLVLGRLRPELEGLAWLAAALLVVLLAVWGVDLQPAAERGFLGVAAAALSLTAGGAWLLRRGAARPARWAALAVTSTLAIDLLAYATLANGELELPWGALQLALAAAWVLLAVPVWRRRAEVAGAEGALSAAAIAAATLAALAAPIELEREWIGVAWALEVAALVWLSGRLALPLLGRLAAGLGALVAARLLLNPFVLRYEAAGSTWPAAGNPVLSWLLHGYGVPLAAFAAAAALARRQGRRRLAPAFGAGAVALAVVGLALSVRQAFHPGGLEAPPTALAEWGALTVLWLLLATGLLAVAMHRQPGQRLPELRWGGAAVATLAAGQALLGQSLAANPAWTHLDVGALPVANAILLAFGAPAILLVIALRLEAWLGGTASWSGLLRRGWGAAGLVLLFLLVTLEVRRAFRGRFLDIGAAGHAERYAYSAAWVALATALLVAGIASGRRALRLASLPVMLLAVVKVFLWDTAHLPDLYRVVSFLGLGASLLFLAWVYQRFVFRAPPPAVAAADAGT